VWVISLVSFQMLTVDRGGMSEVENSVPTSNPLGTPDNNAAAAVDANDGAQGNFQSHMPGNNPMADNLSETEIMKLKRELLTLCLLLTLIG